MELILFIGLQGAGKSSFYRERFQGTHVHVSKDLWPKARRKEARQQRLISQALAAGRSVVVDNTHPAVEDRAPLIALGKAHGARVVGYVFESRLEDCLARNAERLGRARVPDVALYATRKKLRWPSPAEGFDVLHCVRMDPAGGFLVEEWRDHGGAHREALRHALPRDDGPHRGCAARGAAGRVRLHRER